MVNKNNILVSQNYAKKLIKHLEINCESLTILTEAASGNYLYNPLIPILANCKKVYTFCKNSRFASTKAVETQMHKEFSKIGLEKSYEFITDCSPQILAEVDIITNSGHLRPFTKKIFCYLKKTAVLPLMWEPWEIRPGEIDFIAAKKSETLILGTNEHEAPCDTRLYSFLTAMHLAMSQKISIVNDKILVIGDQFTLSESIQQGFIRLGIECRGLKTNENADKINEKLKWATYIIVAEHKSKKIIIGNGGLISTDLLSKYEIFQVGVISGIVDRQALIKKGIDVFPNKLQPHGYMSYSPEVLGVGPVMDLFAAGIKVGQEMARARLSGLNLKDSTLQAMQKSPALDLPDELSWL